MSRRMRWFAVVPVAVALLGATLGFAFKGKSDAKAEIKAQVIDPWLVAFKAKDSAKVMTFYGPGDSVLAFDVVPPRQYATHEAYQKDYEELFKMIDGPLNAEVNDLSITSNGSDMAYGHSIDHLAGKTPDGKQIDLTVRVSDVYRKIGGKWLIVHEHVSVPVDIMTGQADLQSKP
ncbi:MAG TPA: nuclear transport factor 2 family protein [Candidatus Angelobacter sp.]|nr:nuclear transport factor 2 family protein [Candidatus Angelobacter sp.]